VGTKIWFRSPEAFANPPFGRAGNIGRNQFSGPGMVNFDLSWTKNTKITERVGFKLVVQSYNIFNHPHFSNPGADPSAFGNLLNSGLMGLITSTVSRPDATTSARQMQVALRVEF
jgi:hypothetical protein